MIYMSLSELSDEQVLLRETVTRLGDRFGADPQRIEEQVADASAADLVFELGLPGMRLPVDEDDSGATVADVSVVAEAAARAPAVFPLLGPMLALELMRLASAPSEPTAKAASGELRVTIALTPRLDDLAHDGDEAVAWDAGAATHAVGLSASGGLALFEVSDRRVESADPTRPIFAVESGDAQALTSGPIRPETEAAWKAFACTLLSADLLGSMEGALERALEYARERHQFGRPIGSFQAVKHLLADAFVSTFATRSAGAHAADCVDSLAPSEALFAARTAKAFAAKAARSAIETGMQVHGAMGSTWESPFHLYLRRALVNDAVLGALGRQLDAIAAGRLGERPLGPIGNDDEPEFRRELREWLADNAPREPLPESGDEHGKAVREWQRRLHSGGWSGLSIPADCGGGGRSPLFEGILNEEIAAAGAPPILDSVYLSHIVVAFGSETQRKTWIPRMLSGEEWWCQGFSEPEAGSDLASLRTRAVRDGGDWIISGQKTWTTSGQWADVCLVLARTDLEAPRHKGISAFVVPMDSPGVSVRPIRQPSGHSEFAEVFFEDVRVPDDRMLGRPGDGWKIAMLTVTLERGPADSGYAAKHLALLKRLEEHVRERPEDVADAGVRRALAESYVDIEVLRLRVRDSLAERARKNAVGPESSADKLLMIRTEQRLHHLVLKLLPTRVARLDDANLLSGYLASRAASVYGGTEQIQKDIVANRVLGLPRE